MNPEIGYDDVTPETLDFGDHVGKPWSGWRAAEAGGVRVEVRHTHNGGGNYEARTLDSHDGKRGRATSTDGWRFAAARAANKLIEARKAPADKALSGEIVPAGSYSPEEWGRPTRIPADTRLLLDEITEAARAAGLAVARLCELLHESRAHWPEADRGGWAWRLAIESECGIAASLAEKMARAWETVLRYPAWEDALRETRDAWDLDALTTTANALRDKDPDGALADDAGLAAAFAIDRRALRQRRVRDLLSAFEARRIADAEPGLELDGGATPEGLQMEFEIRAFERYAGDFMTAARRLKASAPHAGPMRDRIALMTDRVAGVVDGLAETLAAEDF